MAKKSKKQPTKAEIEHRKFLSKMGVLPKQLKERKKARERTEDERYEFRPDTLTSVRRFYDD